MDDTSDTYRQEGTEVLGGLDKEGSNVPVYTYSTRTSRVRLYVCPYLTIQPTVPSLTLPRATNPDFAAAPTVACFILEESNGQADSRNWEEDASSDSPLPPPKFYPSSTLIPRTRCRPVNGLFLRRLPCQGGICREGTGPLYPMRPSLALQRTGSALVLLQISNHPSKPPRFPSHKLTADDAACRQHLRRPCHPW